MRRKGRVAASVEDFFDDEHDVSNEPRREGGWLVLAVVVVLALLAGGGYVWAHQEAADRVPLRTNVDGIEIGGMTPTAAQQQLQSKLGPKRDRPLQVQNGIESEAVKPSDIGLSVDFAATVRRAGGGPRSWAPQRVWDYFAGGRSIDPVTKVDQDQMDGGLSAISQRVGITQREGSVRFVDGEAIPTYSQDGAGLDIKQARGMLINAFRTRTNVVLPVSTSSARVSDEAVKRAMREVATPAMSAPVRFMVEKRPVVLSPRQLSPVLSMVPRGQGLVLVVDAPGLSKLIVGRVPGAAERPTAARVDIVNNKPRVVPSKRGLTIPTAQLQRQVTATLAKPGPRRVVTVRPTVTEPALATTQARAFQIRRVLATITASLPASDPTTTAAAAKAINGRLIAPTTDVSMRTLLGPAVTKTMSVDPAAQTAVNAVASAANAALNRAGITMTGTTDTAPIPGVPARFGITLADNADLTGRNSTARAVLLSATTNGTEVIVKAWSR